MNRWVRNIVHASMMKTRLLAAKAVTKIACFSKNCRFSRRDASRRSILVADTHQIGPAQLSMNVNMPTATTLYPLTPLYALERSIEEMALDPPNAKKEAY